MTRARISTGVEQPEIVNLLLSCLLRNLSPNAFLRSVRTLVPTAAAAALRRCSTQASSIRLFLAPLIPLQKKTAARS